MATFVGGLTQTCVATLAVSLSIGGAVMTRARWTYAVVALSVVAFAAGIASRFVVFA